MLRSAQLSITVTLLAFVAQTASAQVFHDSLRPHALVPRPAASGTPVPIGSAGHAIFGRIVRLSGTSFALALRSGRTLNVDASPAIASGRLSAPLFVGKLVIVTGAMDSRGTLTADSVTRMTTIDSSTRPDR